VIAIQLPNTIEFALTVLAAYRAGLVVAVLPLLWRQAELTMALNRTAARAIVTSAKVDGIVYASMSALGFAMTENILYYGRAALGGGGSLTAIFIIRGFFAPFSHPLFTSLTGIGLGLARQSRNTFVKLIAPIFGLMAAISMHAIWNGSARLFGGGLAEFQRHAIRFADVEVLLLVLACGH